MKRFNILTPFFRYKEKRLKLSMIWSHRRPSSRAWRNWQPRQKWRMPRRSWKKPLNSSKPNENEIFSISTHFTFIVLLLYSYKFLLKQHCDNFFSKTICISWCTYNKYMWDCESLCFLKNTIPIHELVGTKKIEKFSSDY